ncbi:hypothetical protein [Sandarakinorhabdus sp. DWP1-3-1]|uniref:hypothetical protein n=1 Tax=Sandarakinorhabdus sp. DWP1-3-1 TaxID=2804627 RepID=UPI003CF8F7FB
MTDDPARRALKAVLDRHVAALVANAPPDWPISADHCFLRVAYDNAMGDRWDRLVQRPAWRHLPVDRLAAAVDILARIATEGLPLLAALNTTSLDYRRRHRHTLRRHP